MSGPKCGHYQVVSAEELRRRELLAAQDRYSRTVAAVEAFQRAVGVAEATHGELGVLVAPAARLQSQDAAAFDQASESLTTALEAARRQLDAAVAAARVRALSADAAHISSVLVEEPRPERKAAAASAGEPKREETLTRILGRLPADAAPDVVDRCDALARRYRDAAGQAEQARLLDSIRLLVQQEQDRQALVRRNDEVLEGLYRQLDGLTGETATTLRGILKGLDRSAELPADLRDRVAAARSAAEAERDREFVLAAAANALADLGYSVGDDFRTAVPASGTLLELPHSSKHGLQVRERNQQLLLNVVRIDADGNRDPLADKDAEESFCRDFAQLKDELRLDGIELQMLRADAPGQTPMQVFRGAPPVRRARERPAAPVQRERRR